jgi:tetratricopeptide (TPR) repeat protein
MARGRNPVRFMILCLLFCLLPVALVHAQEDRFTEGVRQYQDGQYQSAATAFEEATTANPNFESAWYYLGVVRLKLQDYEGALEAFQKAVDLAPARAGTRLMVGQIYESQSAFTEAVKVYEDELRYRHGKDSLPVLNSLGRSQYRAGSYEAAIVTLSRTVAEDPKYVEALYYLGLSHAARDNNAQAVKYYEQAGTVLEQWRKLVTRLARLRTLQTKSALTPAQQREIGQVEETLAQDYGRAQDFGTEQGLWPTLNKARGNSLLALKEWAAARNAYRKALDKEQLGSPSDADTYSLISLGLLAQAKSVFMDDSLLFTMIDILKEAEKQGKEAVKRNESYAPAHNALGEIYLFEAQTYSTKPELNITSHTCQDAIKEFELALKYDSNYVRAMSNMAECLLLTDKAEDARDQLNKAITLAPKRDDLHAQMAEVLLALEMPDEALEEAQTAMLINRKSVEGLNAAGTVYMYYKDNLGEATDYFSRAVAADPRRWESYVNLGLAFYQMESWYRARREFKSALDRIPTAIVANTSLQQAYLYYLIARTYHATNMYDQEVASLNEALGRYPTHLDTLRQLAVAYEAQHKYRAAEEVLGSALKATQNNQEEADINIQLGQMLEKEGRPHEAIAAYSAALQADPNSLAAKDGLERLEGGK